MAFFSARQETLYHHLADIWALAQTSNVTTKRRQAKTYTRIAQAEPCHFQLRQSVDEPHAMGGIEGDNIFTRDVIHFAEYEGIDNDMVVVNKTLDFDGNPAENYGRFWVVAGQPTSIARVGNRDAGKRSVQAVQVHEAPRGVTVD